MSKEKTLNNIDPKTILSEHPIIYFSPSDWWFGKADWALLAEEFSLQTRVLFINTISPSIPKIGSKSFSSRLKRKLPSVVKIFRNPNPNIYVLTPIVLPFLGKIFPQKINTVLLIVQLRIITSLLKFKNPILWVSNVATAQIIDKISYNFLIYSVTDKWDKTRYIDAKKKLTRFDKTLTKKADAILCVSKKLYRHYRKITHKTTFYMPHAVDYNHFAITSTKGVRLPEDISKIPSPIIGYYGSLSKSNDIDTFMYCAKRKQDWSFVLIGRAGEGFSELKKLPNVFMLGPKNYNILPVYANCFDVCLLFWNLTDWISFCSPYKTKEYLAMGKSVVSVPIPEIIEEFSDTITVAYNKEDFLKSLESELKNDTKEKQKLRREKVREHTWENYVQEVERILLSILRTRHE